MFTTLLFVTINAGSGAFASAYDDQTIDSSLSQMHEILLGFHSQPLSMNHLRSLESLKEKIDELVVSKAERHLEFFNVKEKVYSKGKQLIQSAFDNTIAKFLMTKLERNFFD